MTNAEKALSALIWIGEMSDAQEWAPWFRETIERSLKIAAAVDGDGLVMHDKNFTAAGNNDLLERLKAIGGGG